MLWLVFLAIGAHVRHASVDSQTQALQDRIRAGEQENARLTDELDRLHRPESLTLLARTRLNYKQSGETVVFVYKSEKSGTISQPQATPDERNNVQKWRDWLRGR